MEIYWRVRYKNKDFISQSNLSYNEIDRNNLSEFQLMKGEKVVFSMLFSEGQGNQLIWRRRVQKSPGVKEDKVAHIVGKKGIFVCAFFDDGTVLVDDDFREDNGWLYPPQYQENEVN
jgi:hypothetical protein